VKQYEILKKNQNKIVYVHCSSGEKQALQEILTKTEILSQIKDTKALNDVKAMEKFNETLGIAMDKVVFGMKGINFACDKNGIDMLLYSDDYIRKLNSTKRIEFSKLINKVELNGGKAIKMSSKHITGESK